MKLLTKIAKAAKQDSLLAGWVKKYPELARAINPSFNAAYTSKPGQGAASGVKGAGSWVLGAMLGETALRLALNKDTRAVKNIGRFLGGTLSNATLARALQKKHEVV